MVIVSVTQYGEHIYDYRAPAKTKRIDYKTQGHADYSDDNIIVLFYKQGRINDKK